MQRARARIVRESCDGGLQFIYYESELAVGMKGEVARSGSSVELGVGRDVRREGAGFGVEAVDEQLIQAEIDSNGKTIIGSGLDPVSVRTLLAFVVDARSEEHTSELQSL